MLFNNIPRNIIKNFELNKVCVYWISVKRCVERVNFCSSCFNLLKTTGHVMHKQFNIQQLYALPHTVFMCFVFIWEKTATCATYSINWLVFITQMKSVYSAVRTGSLNKAVCASSLEGLRPYTWITWSRELECNSRWHNSNALNSKRFPYKLIYSIVSGNNILFSSYSYIFSSK